jgi:hypothetical protein
MLTSKFENPVTLPLGRAKFVTTPLATGSSTSANTIGIVLVACCNARVAGVLFASSTSGASAITAVPFGMAIISEQF